MRNHSKIKIKTRLQAIAISLCALFLITCTSYDSPPEWKKVMSEIEKSNSGKESSQKMPKVSNHLVIYLDTSSSMAGYISADGNTTYGKSVRKLREVAGIFNNPEVKVLVRYVDSQVKHTLPAEELAAASQNQGLYRGGETNLAGAVSNFNKSVEDATTQPQILKANLTTKESDEREQIPPRFSVLVTDGVQSTKGKNSSEGCNAGSDQFCVRQQINELLKNGWHGCVLGVRSEFNGKVYSEANGAVIPYQSNQNNFDSFRPFYIFIFSPDRDALDRLVQSLKEDLRPLVQRQDLLRELNLTFPYSEGFAKAEIQIPKDSAVLEKGKAENGDTARLTLRVDVDKTTKAGPKPFKLAVNINWSKHALDGASPEELVRAIRWELKPVYPNLDDEKKREEDEKKNRYARLEIKKQEIEANGKIVLEMEAGWLLDSKTPRWCVYRLVGKLDLDRTPRWTPAWIENWSTDNDSSKDVANRTYNLKLALLSLWNNQVLKNQSVAEVYLRVGPQ